MSALRGSAPGRRRPRWLGLAVLVLITACAPLPRRPKSPPCPSPPKPPSAAARYERARYTDLPGWGEAALAASFKAFVVGCARVAAASPLQVACAAARAVPAHDEPAVRNFFEAHFLPYRIIAPDGARKGLVTGYYEPILAGSLTRSPLYRIPVYGVPRDLVEVDLASQYPELKGMRLRGRLDGHRLVPYYSRAAIHRLSRSKLRGIGQGLPAPVLAWVADPVDLFFLQIQGSGQIRLPSGKRIRLGYANQNGYPYRSLGRYLIEQGDLEPGQASMQAIKAWAEAHPERLQQALDYNASYIFFRELPPNQPGPVGTLGVALSAGYSVAVDRRYVPLGAPAFLATTYPLSARTLDRLVVAQDTGGAIHGALRVDFFWGSGDAAGVLAGRMQQTGRLWLLWPRSAPAPNQ